MSDKKRNKKDAADGGGGGSAMASGEKGVQKQGNLVSMFFNQGGGKSGDEQSKTAASGVLEPAKQRDIPVI